MRGSYTIKLTMLAMIMVLISCLAGVSRASEVELTERPDTEFLILALEINGFLRDEGIDAYLPEEASFEDILIPLAAFSNALSVSIETDPATGEAEGFFLSEDRVFQLNMIRGQVQSGKDIFEIPEEGVEAHFDDIYVQAHLLEDWFDLNISFQASTLTLAISADINFPFQKSRERQRRADKLLTKSRKAEFSPDNAYLLPYKLFNVPTLVVQQTLTGTETPEDSARQLQTSVQAGFDLLKFNANMNLSYARDNMDQDEITNSSLTLTRSDPKKEMLGPLKAGRIQIGDVDFPSVPLFGGGGRGAGIAISSDADFGFRFAEDSGRIIIEDDAPVGWDVELYRNGQFIDFQVVGANGRFSFSDVQLINGFNRFQILLFGPEGQERTLTRDIFGGPNMLAEGQLKYDAAIGMPGADFLPLTDEPRQDDRLSGSAEIFYGISNFLTAGARLFVGPDGEESAKAASFSLGAAFLGFNLQAEKLKAEDKQEALQLGLRRRFLGFNFGATQTTFDGFDEDDQDREKTTNISVSRNIGPLTMTVIAEKQEFQDPDQDRTVYQNIASTELLGFRISNELEKTVADSETLETFDGELSLFREIFDTRVRTNFTYDLDPDAEDTLQTIRLNAQKKLTDASSFRLGSTYDVPSKILSLDGRYSREFDPVSLDFNFGGTSEDTYFAGVTMRVSLQPKRGGGFDFVSPRLGTLASLDIRAFIDDNENSIYDEGEKLIKDIAFQSSKSQTKAVTGEDGVARLYGLAETPTKLFVSKEAIPSIYLEPARKDLAFIPRRGTSSVVDFPFTQLGEIDGFLTSTIDNEPLANVPIIITNAETGEELEEVTSEYDGYFVFSSLPMGRYKVIASYSWFDENDDDTTSSTVILSSAEPTVFDLSLKLKPEIEQPVYGPPAPDIFIGPLQDDGTE